MIVRAEEERDRKAVFDVNALAFGRDNEARLVESLRRSPAFIPELSLVALDRPAAPDADPAAEAHPVVVGHVLFTKVAIRDGSRSHDALALAPLAVLPSHQRRGFGAALVRRGLADARRFGHRAVIVVGHPEYYPRFGFVPAFPLGIRAPFDVSAASFMALALLPDALRGVRGEVEYPSEFAEV
jgi:putative acetyltransferase